MPLTMWNSALRTSLAVCVGLLSLTGIGVTRVFAQPDEPVAAAVEDVAAEEAAVEEAAVEEAAVEEQEQVFEAVVDDEAEERIVDGLVVNGFWQANDPTLAVLARHVRVHSALARRCCKLSDEQEQQLSNLDKKWLESQVAKADKSPVKQAAAGIARFFGVGGRANLNGRNQEPHEIVATVREAIDSEIVTILGTQADKFTEELESQREFRKQAMTDILVSVLDRRLYLTSDQREALRTKVREWLSRDLYWQFYFQNDGYVPDIPRSILTSVLDENQLQAIKGVQTWNYDYNQIELQLIGQELQFLIKK